MVASGQPDWSTLLASELFAGFPIPHMVLSGQVFPGDMGHMVARTGSGEQLKSLLNGTLANVSDMFVSSSTDRLRTAESRCDSVTETTCRTKQSGPDGTVNARTI